MRRKSESELLLFNNFVEKHSELVDYLKDLKKRYFETGYMFEGVKLAVEVAFANMDETLHFVTSTLPTESKDVLPRDAVITVDILYGEFVRRAVKLIIINLSNREYQ